MAVKVLIDGRLVSFEDEMTATFMQQRFTDLTKQLEDAKKAMEAAEEEQEEEKKVRGERDALLGQIAVLKKQLEDAQLQATPAAIDAAVKQRTEVLLKANALMEGRASFDGKDTTEIMRTVVVAKLGDSARAKDAGFIEGAFNALTAGIKTSQSGTDRLADALAVNGVQLPPNHAAGFLTGNVNDDIKRLRDAARAQYEKNLTEAWKTPARQS